MTNAEQTFRPNLLLNRGHLDYRGHLDKEETV